MRAIPHHSITDTRDEREARDRWGKADILSVHISPVSHVSLVMRDAFRSSEAEASRQPFLSTRDSPTFATVWTTALLSLRDATSIGTARYRAEAADDLHLSADRGKWQDTFRIRVQYGRKPQPGLQEA